MDELLIFTGSKVLDHLFDELKDYAINKFNKVRVNKFLKELFVSLDVDSEIASDKFKKYVKDESKRELLLNSMKSVVFTRSKNFGPQAIAFIIAKIIKENRTANSIEISLIDLFENLWDDEFEKMFKDINEILKSKLESIGKFIIYTMNNDTISSWDSNYYKNLYVPFHSYWYGSWATKCSMYGFLNLETKEESYNYEADSEIYVDEPGVENRIFTQLYIRKEFIDIVKRIIIIKNIQSEEEIKVVEGEC